MIFSLQYMALKVAITESKIFSINLEKEELLDNTKNYIKIQFFDTLKSNLNEIFNFKPKIQ